MMSRLPAPFLLALLFLAPAQAQTPADVTLDPAFGGTFFNFPVGVRHAGDGSGRRFVIERAGRIRIVDAQDQVLGTPFLDISSQVDTTFEGGFLGIAFHPDYASNGRLYVKYTFDGNAGPATHLVTRISRFTSPTPSANTMPAASEQVLLEVPQDFNNHNGGDLHFGSDGYLYIGMGDGGDGNDPCNRSQTLDPGQLLTCGNHATTPAKALLGKMLRIDVNATTPAGSNNLCAAGGDGSARYALPADNPYVGMGNRCGEVWSYGLRNPYRFSFDRDTGDLWIGDVGQGTWEEINFEPAADAGGRNWGWKVCEGNWQRGSTTVACSLSGHSGPVIEYRTGQNNNCSVTGGFRYRGPVASMTGLYVYGDYCSGRIWFASETSPGEWTPTEFGGLTGFGLVGFGEDESGNLYMTRGNGQILIFNGDTAVLYSIGGTVSGLEGNGLVLQNNGGDDLGIQDNGSFAFATGLAENATYSVTVISQPTDPLQECTVANASGTVGTDDIDNILVSCVTQEDEIFEDRFEQ
ncbi:MAG: hypothetical protein EA370_07050 [Wenzhouxiangella sp.]|nr:MAG: hypothetical protein EA370_07050 [Wenzhouxiangella sp.]